MFSFFKNKISNSNNKNDDKIESSSSSSSYENANYYNFFRKLEQNNTDEQSYRNRISLKPRKPNNFNLNVFKLESFEVMAEMNDSSISECWTQTYHNESNVPVEAVYKLPLSPLSVVSKFVVEYQGKTLIGKIKEKSKAQEKYNDSIASGGQAFIGEKSDGVFTFVIGNLPPNENVTIRLTITSEVGTHLSSLHYCLHRYMVPYGSFVFDFKLNIKLLSKIKSLKLINGNGPNKSIVNKSNDEKNATIEFTNRNDQNAIIKKNIIVMIESESNDKPQSFIEYNGKDQSYAIGLNFYPCFDQIKQEDIMQKSEYIFVIDCSGSMSGEPIKKAKRALEICVRSLNEQNKFNIYCFGSSFKKCFKDGSILYNDESLEIASKYIDKISADLGGTELLPPIRDILKKDCDQEYPRTCFILTDGEVSERDQLIDFVAKESNTTRIFTFGIGTSFDQELVVGLSNACKGYYTFIRSNDEMEEKVMKLLNIANEPTLSNISINWGEKLLSSGLVQSPSIIRPIYNRERMMIYALLNNGLGEHQDTIKSTPQIVEMVGNGPLGEQLKFQIELDFNKVDNEGTNQIHTLAAFKQIQDLEEEERKSKKDNKDKIVELGKKYGLVSKHTSVIVTIEGNGDVVESSMKTVNVLNNDSGDQVNQVDYDSISDYSDYEEEEENATVSFKRKSNQKMSRKSSISSSSSSDSDDNDDDDESEDKDDSNGEELEQLEESDQLEGAMIIEKEREVLSSKNVSKKCEKSSSLDMFEKSKLKSKPMLKKSLQPSLSVSKDIKDSRDSKDSKSNGGGGGSGDTLMNLIKLQKASGYWVKSSITQFKINMDKAPKELSTPETENIWSTLLVIAKLNKDFSSKKNEWQTLVIKSIKWVKQQLKTLNLLDSFDKFENLSKSLV